jgi:hypothetical protein
VSEDVPVDVSVVSAVLEVELSEVEPVVVSASADSPVDSSSEPVVAVSSPVAAAAVAELGSVDVGPLSAGSPGTHVPPTPEPAETG